ncbi:hypothetical protein LY76DRAFT_247079 [Colletotrichum caudatum]|nr:hypothetical protein LY76DRAFT_247079 [Colletotrichum caudatum]
MNIISSFMNRRLAISNSRLVSILFGKIGQMLTMLSTYYHYYPATPRLGRAYTHDLEGKSTLPTYIMDSAIVSYSEGREDTRNETGGDGRGGSIMEIGMACWEGSMTMKYRVVVTRRPPRGISMKVIGVGGLGPGSDRARVSHPCLHFRGS